MSRHRAVRNMNIEEELGVDALPEGEDEEEYDISPEDQGRLDDAVEQVRDIIGTESASDISDAFLKDVVWNNYFDVGRSVEEVMEEKERRQLQAERKDAEYYDENGAPINEDYLGLAYANQAGLADQHSVYTKRLSTISERTERSERTQQSQPWPTHQELLAAHAPRRAPSTPTTSSYGQVIHPSASRFGLASRSGGIGGEDDGRTVMTTSDFGQVIDTERFIDPNDIHPSPSLSAIRHLSIRTPSPTPTLRSGKSSSTAQPVVIVQQPSPPTIASTPQSPVKALSVQATSEAPPRRTSRPPSETPQGRYRTAATESSRPPSEAPQTRYRAPTESSIPPSEAPQNRYKAATEFSRPPSEAPQTRHRAPTESSGPPSEVPQNRYKADTETSRPPSEAPKGRYKIATESSRPPSEAPQNRYKAATESSRPPSEAPQARYRPTTERSYSLRSHLDRGGPSETTRRSTEDDPPPRKSKLASLASSRLPSSRSKAPSEASESYVSTSSFATYPDLRPQTLSSNSTSAFDPELQQKVDEAIRAGSRVNPDLYGARAKMMRATKEPVPYDPRTVPTIYLESESNPISIETPEAPRTTNTAREEIASHNFTRPTPHIRRAQLRTQENTPVVEPIRSTARSSAPPAAKGAQFRTQENTPLVEPARSTARSSAPPAAKVSPPPVTKVSSPSIAELVNTPRSRTPSVAVEPSKPTVNEARPDRKLWRDVATSPIHNLNSVASVAEMPGPIVPPAADASVPEIPTPSDPAPASKLALLAQARAAKREHTSRHIQRPRVLGPPYATTEYLTPETDDSSMTTAITTYSQTLGNMVPLSRAKLPPSFPPEDDEGSDANAKRQSKLAMKARKTQKKTPAEQALEEAERTAAQYLRSRIEDPLYNRTTGDTAALPSSFASLLVDDSKRVKEEKARAKAEAKAERARLREEERMRRRQRKEALLPMHLLNPATLKETVFAFDIPSPDDVVMDARRGTALGAGRQSTASSRKAASAKAPSLIASSVG